MRSIPLLALLALACTEPAGSGAPRLVTERTAELGQVVDGNTAFALDIYGAVAQDEGNLFFSPYSMSSALSMTCAGAAGTTAEEMEAVLHMSGDAATWHHELGALTRDLSGDQGRGYSLHIANRLFGQEGYPWKQPFLDINAQDYGAPLQDVDYIADPEAARGTINDWVAEQTRDRIEELLPAGSITDATRLVLTNAIYFKADWLEQFDTADTYDGTFTLGDGSTVTTPLMKREGELELGWAEDADALVARLPYQDDEVSMWVLLPSEHDGMPDLEAALTPEAFDTWIASARPVEDSVVVLPKFEVRYELSLSDVLKDLGMPSAFDSATADFSGIADVPEDGRLYISDVIHEAFVHVDEKGTEAAAATGVVVGVDSAPPMLIADHPFLYLIRDDLTGSILFMGRLSDPS